MSEAKHTPGPWRVEKLGSIDPWTDALSILSTDEHGCTHWLASTTRGFEGALLPNGEHDETSCAWANARLIAASPDFAAGVAVMITHEESGGDGWWRGYEMLKAAYRKAGLDHDAPWFKRETDALAKASAPLPGGA